MAWYRTGTISLTNGSTAVTGSGTAWISNAAVGEALLAPDGKLYEIANIASDTSITLGSSYLGTTQSGQAYVIVPSQSYIRDLAAQAAALVNNYSTFYNTVGQGKFPDGAVATPAISFSNDTNTGLYRSAADEVTLVANGVAIAKWNTSGFSFVSGVSTITANSTSPALKITQTGTGNALVVEDAAGDTTPFVIDQSGNVILQDLSARAIAGFTPGLQMNSYSSSSASALSQTVFRNDATGVYHLLNKSRGTSAASHVVVQSGDDLGTIQFNGSDGTNFIPASLIMSEVDGTPGPNDMPGRLVFSTTADNASTPTERMRIDSSGNVGIGATAAAGRKLEVRGNATGAANSYHVFSAAAVQSDVSSFTSFSSYPSTQATTFTLVNLIHYAAEQSTVGAGSTVTNQMGFQAHSSLTGATNNYGFYGSIPAGTGRYNFYAAGTADNVFNGNVRVINGSATLGYGLGAGGTVTQTGSRTTGVTLSKPTGAITLVSAAGSTAWQSFTVTNTVVAAEDVIKVCQKSGTDKYMIHVTNVAAGSFQITFATTGGTTTEQPVFSFAVIKGAVA